MKATILTSVAIIVVATAGSAFAQSAPSPRAPIVLAQSTGAAVTLTDEDRTFVRTYVEKHKHPSVKYEDKVVIGADLPKTVKVYKIEGRPTLSTYEYAVVNDQTVLVNAKTGKIVEIID